MGSFSNKTYTNIIDGLVEATNSKINNPYYVFSDKKPTKVTYYRQNAYMSTVDRGSKLQYAHVSKQSALKFNKIIDFVLYGIDKITVDYEVGDDGPEANPISGEAIILPNTIVPYDGDFFSIPYLKEDLLFKVDSITPDTLDTGANFYKIEYHLELINQSSQIESQVSETYNFVVSNAGTDFNCLLTSTQIDMTEKLESLSDQLINFFDGTFYKHQVQTFVYASDRGYIYDPYMIEFIRRNKLFGSRYIAHQTITERTFAYNYTKSIFYALEQKDSSLFIQSINVTADLITDINSLFTSRLENYYEVRYTDNGLYKERISILPKELTDAVKSGKTISGNKNSFYNLIVNYFNGSESYITDSIVDDIKKLESLDNRTLFYMVIFYIFIIQSYIKSNILAK